MVILPAIDITIHNIYQTLEHNHISYISQWSHPTKRTFWINKSNIAMHLDTLLAYFISIGNQILRQWKIVVTFRKISMVPRSNYHDLIYYLVTIKLAGFFHTKTIIWFYELSIQIKVVNLSSQHPFPMPSPSITIQC